MNKKATKNLPVTIFTLLAFSCVFFSSLASAQLPDFTKLVEETSPAVVNISTIKHAGRHSRNGYQNGLPDQVPEILRHFFEGMPGLDPRHSPKGPHPRNTPHNGKAQPASLGSGFVISEDGYILTNNHVVKDADEIIVRFNDRRELEAKVIGLDPSSDLALLKVSGNNLPTVKLGRSDTLKVGEWVVAIGSPFGFDYSVTAGIVSAKGRSLPSENYVPFIQTDVAINPGNSGGPLFNLEGKVVGINSQIYTRSGGFMGVSFAIPIDVAMDVAEQLKNDGKVSRGWLGVVIQEVNKDLAESFGLDKAQGALVAQMVEGGPAEQAGIEAGDIILKVNGKGINLSSDLPHLVGIMKPASQAKLAIVRNGKHKIIKVTIGALPDSSQSLAAQGQGAQPKMDKNRLGVQVAPLGSSSSASHKNIAAGVIVQQVESNSAGAMAGLVRGDVITMIYGESITSPAELSRVLKSVPTNRSVPMRIIRRGSAMFVPLRLKK